MMIGLRFEGKHDINYKRSRGREKAKGNKIYRCVFHEKYDNGEPTGRGRSYSFESGKLVFYDEWFRGYDIGCDIPCPECEPDRWIGVKHG